MVYSLEHFFRTIEMIFMIYSAVNFCLKKVPSGSGRARRAQQFDGPGRAGSQVGWGGPGGPEKVSGRFGPGRATKKWPVSSPAMQLIFSFLLFLQHKEE